VRGLGFGIQGVGFGVEGVGFRVPSMSMAVGGGLFMASSVAACST